MLKITAQDDASRTVLALEGKLAGPWVEELKACWEKTGGGRPITIYLCAVTFVDEQGKNLLAEMYRGGAELAAKGCMNQAIVDEIARGGRT